MLTSLVVFENGELKREPTEVTYRTVTYYFDDTVAKAVEAPAPAPAPAPVAAPVPAPVLAPSVPEVLLRDFDQPQSSEINYGEMVRSLEISENPPALTLAKPPVNEAYELYLTGRNRFDAGDAKGAVDSYLLSIKLEPKSAEVFLNLGHAYLKLTKNADAIKAFKESIKLNPDQPESQYGLGVAAFRTNRYKDAADAFKKAVTLSPSMAKAHYGLSLAYQELGETSKFLDEYRILERLDNSLAKRLTQTFPQYDYSCRLIRGCP